MSQHIHTFLQQKLDCGQVLLLHKSGCSGLGTRRGGLGMNSILTMLHYWGWPLTGCVLCRSSDIQPPKMLSWTRRNTVRSVHAHTPVTRRAKPDRRRGVRNSCGGGAWLWLTECPEGLPQCYLVGWPREEICHSTHERPSQPHHTYSPCSELGSDGLHIQVPTHSLLHTGDQAQR